jgi:hypothetical protein
VHRRLAWVVRFWLSVTVVGLAATLLLERPAPAQAISGKQPLAVVLCKFKDQQNEPQAVSYYQDMFSESGAGKNGVFDFWKTVSYGNLDLTGTVVKGWYTADKTVAEFNVLPRREQIDVCASKATADINFNNFAGVVVLTNHTNLNGPLFGAGPPTTIAGTTYARLGLMAAEEDQQLNGILHETGHAFGLNHSRRVSQIPDQDDYGDRYDVMSCLGCEGTTKNSYQGEGGPGLNAVQLATAGWLRDDRVLRDFTTDACTQRTVQMAALNHPEASGYLQARIPAAVPIKKISTSTTSDYYSIELRSKSGWDEGIPADTFLLHLKGQDNYSYWVDQAGALTAGRQYVDAERKAYVAVNSIDPQAHTGVVTLASCKINVNLNYTGPTSGTYHDQVTLTADLKVDPNAAPVPNAPVTLTLGAQSCTATTQASGRASCTLRLDQAAGTYTVTASYAGSQAYNAQSAGRSFTIVKRASAVRYAGPSSVTNGSAATLTASLTEDGGAPIGNRPVSFTLGSGPLAQACGGTTAADGSAQCTISRVLQPAGPTGVRVAFAGDDFYLPSSAVATAEAIKGSTALRYEGPSNIANDFPAPFRATLTQQDGGVPLENRAVAFTVGSGASAQSCTGTTDGSGRAACTVPSVAQPAGATGAQVRVAFAGDDFFLPSNTSATMKLLYYTGTAYGLSTKVALLPRTVAADTGDVSTASKSTTDKSAASLRTPLVSVASLNAGVTTGGGKSTAQARTGEVTIGLAGLPVIRATAVHAVSESVCRVEGFTATASGGVTIESLTIGGVLHSTASVAPNTVIRIGTATITLNEQRPVADSSAGLLVNAIHVAAPGIADVVIASAQSAVHHCP